MQDSDRRNSSRRSSEDRDFSPIDEMVEEGYVEEHTHPRRGWPFFLIVGLVKGIIALVAPIWIVYANASLFTEGARLGENMPTQVAGLISLWGTIGFVCSALIIFFLAIITAPIYVTRKQGLMTGRLAGGIVYAGIFLAHYLPSYPDILSSGARTSATGTGFQGAIVVIGSLIIYALIGGAMNVWGRALGLWLRRFLRK